MTNNPLTDERLKWLHDAATELDNTKLKMTMKPSEMLWLTTELQEYRKAGDRCAALAEELCAVEAIHNDAVFITDEHYEHCPPEVQKIIRTLAVLQIPAYQAFLVEVRAHARNEGINYAASRLAAAYNHGFIDKPLAEVYDVVRMIMTAKEDLANDPLPAADGLSGEYAEKSLEEFAAQLHEGGAS